MGLREPNGGYTPKSGKPQTKSLPVDWAVIRVQDAGEVLGGRQRSPWAQGDMTPYLRVANVFTGYIDTSDILQMPFTAEERARFALRRGDILLNEGQSLDLVGRSAIYRDQPPNCCFQNTLVRFRPNESTDPNYAQYLFESYLHQGEFAKIALQTTSIAHLGAGRFAQMAFVAPPLKEQVAIGESLGDADALIDSLEELLTKKRLIKQGAMQELLTGKRRLPGGSGEWSCHALRDLVQTPVTDGPHTTPIFVESGVPFLSVNNLIGNQIDLTDIRYITRKDDQLFAKKCKPQRGDVLLGKAASVGKVAIVEDDLDFNIWSPIALIRARTTLVPKFLFYQLQSQQVLTQIAMLTNSSSQGNLGMGDIERLRIRYPRVDEQREIADALSDMDAEITALESRLTKARALKQAMAQALLTGHIRLVEPAV